MRSLPELATMMHQLRAKLQQGASPRTLLPARIEDIEPWFTWGRRPQHMEYLNPVDLAGNRPVGIPP